jgi:hypothetical protein
MTGVVNPRQSALEVPLWRHHFSRKLLALLALAGDRLRPLELRCRPLTRMIAQAGPGRASHCGTAQRSEETNHGRSAQKTHILGVRRANPCGVADKRRNSYSVIAVPPWLN